MTTHELPGRLSQNPRRLLLLTSLGVMTLAAAVGCSSRGSARYDEKNYRVLEEDRPMFYTESPTAGSPGLLSSNTNSTNNTGLSAAPTTGPEVPPPTPAAPGTLGPSSVRSIHGLDRSHWPMITVAPADGRTFHGPIYYYNYDLEWSDPQPDLQALATTEEQLQQLNTEIDSRTFTPWSGAGLILQPVGVAVDTALLPARMILRPPWVLVTTP